MACSLGSGTATGAVSSSSTIDWIRNASAVPGGGDVGGGVGCTPAEPAASASAHTNESTIEAVILSPCGGWTHASSVDGGSSRDAGGRGRPRGREAVVVVRRIARERRHGRAR